MLYPFLFQPIFKERVWGGRKLEHLYQKKLPAGLRIGESWEITDRPEEASRILNGPLAGRNLRWLMENHAAQLLGEAHSLNGRFPLLVKIIDAQDVLSLQVHPPATIAASLGGDPKTEMWFVAQSNQESCLYIGLKRGVTRQEFESRLRGGGVADCFHRQAVRTGDAIFLPSGRVHALSAGVVIFEIQQNSDTTYRLFDWNRAGLDGHPRELHLKEALACIDFTDFEPATTAARVVNWQGITCQELVKDPLFSVHRLQWSPAQTQPLPCRKSLILGVIEGELAVGEHPPTRVHKGEFCLVPACLESVPVHSRNSTDFLVAEPG